MKKRTELQEYLYLYGDSTCLSLINLNYESQFFFSMETARSKLSAKYCETLIKKGIHKIKKLNLINRIADAKKHGTNLVYRDLNSAIKELGENLVLDMLNHNLRYRFENNIPIFKLIETSEEDLEVAKARWDKIKYEKQWKTQIKKVTETSKISFLPTREETKGEKEDRERQERSRKEQQEAESIRREKEWEEERNQIENSSGFAKRSLDTDPDDDLSPEIFQLNSLDERKLKNIEVKFDKDEE